MAKAKTHKPLLISFSGGRTSAYMTYLLVNEYHRKREIEVVFANTGKEHEKTLDYVDRCSRRFGWNVVWLEAVVQKDGKGTTHKIVSYKTANRKGDPFENVIKKYGIPNTKYPHCTRELKQAPINSYMRAKHGSDYDQALGIRYDEKHRAKYGPYQKSKGIFYPLVTMWPSGKKHVIMWCKSQEGLDLDLLEREGNCNNCFKKSDKKLFANAIDSPESFDWWGDMGEKYEMVKSNEGRQFYRKHRTASDIVEDAKETKGLTDMQLSLLPDIDQGSGCFCN